MDVLSKKINNERKDGSVFSLIDRFGSDIAIRPICKIHESPYLHIKIPAYSGQPEEFSQLFFNELDKLSPNTIHIVNVRDIDSKGCKGTWSKDILLPMCEDRPKAPIITVLPPRIPGSASITVTSITADDVINIVESQSTIAITGVVGGDATEGDLISFTVNGINYSGSVSQGNTYSIPVAGSDLTLDLSFVITLVQRPTSLLSYTASVTSTHTVDLEALASITISDITTTSVVIATGTGSNVNVTGTVGGEVAVGDIVSTTVNSNFYSTPVVAGSIYSLPILGADLAFQLALTMSVTGSDIAGNPYSAEATQNYLTDIVSDPTDGWTGPEPDIEAFATITVNSITTDDVINSIESGQNINVTGTVGDDAGPGNTVTATINGTDYVSTVISNSTYSLLVVGSDLALDTSFDITVLGTNDLGNPFTASVTSTHTVQTSVSIGVSINDITPDNIITKQEAQGTIVITGSISGSAVSNLDITTTVNGNIYNGVVAVDRTYTISIPGPDLILQSSISIFATGQDTSGNTGIANKVKSYEVAITPSVSITIDPIAEDDILHLWDVSELITITGSVTGDVAHITNTVPSLTLVHGTATAGQEVSVPFVLDSSNNFSVSIPGVALADSLIKSVTVLVNTVDEYGNLGFDSSSRDYIIAPVIFEATVIRVAVGGNSVACNGGKYQVDWGDGNFNTYEDNVLSSSAGGSQSGVIRVRSSDPITQILFPADNCLSISISKSSTLTSLQNTAASLSKLETFVINDTSSITTMRLCFSGTDNLSSISPINGAVLIDMDFAFQGSGISHIDLINTASVLSYYRAFYSMPNLVCLTRLDTTSATNTTDMFFGSGNLVNPTPTEQTQLAAIPGGLDYVNSSPCP